MLTPMPLDLCLVPYKEQNEQDPAWLSGTLAPAMSNTICKGTPQLCAPGLFIPPGFSPCWKSLISGMKTSEPVRQITHSLAPD